MPAVLLAIDHAGVAVQLTAALEAAGHVVTWRTAREGVPGLAVGDPDVVLLDWDSPDVNLGKLIAAWRALDPAPVLIALCDQVPAEPARARLGVQVLGKQATPEALAGAVGEAVRHRFTSGLTLGSALRVIGSRGTGDAAHDARLVVTGSRKVDMEVVREALNPHANQYVTATPELLRLREERALMVPELTMAARLDGSQTLRQLVKQGGLEASAAGRLMWALASVGAAVLSDEPPEDREHPAARAAAWARRCLRARLERVRGATYYDLLDIGPHAEPPEIDEAARHMALWYSPDLLAPIDLGDLAGKAASLWQEVMKARAVLLDPESHRRYLGWMVTTHGRDLVREAARRREQAAEAEVAFTRGLRLLSAGDAFGAVSGLAQAARILPDEPDYEAYAAWARYLAEAARGGDLARTVARERAAVEAVLSGRRPRARALFALGSFCLVGGDGEAARRHLRDAVACDPRMVAAQKALARLGG